MNEEKQRVVKCASCDKFFGYAEDNKNCPFCATAYGDVIEEKLAGEEKSVQEDKPKEIKMRKMPIKTQKDSFKIWKEDAAN